MKKIQPTLHHKTNVNTSIAADKRAVNWFGNCRFNFHLPRSASIAWTIAAITEGELDVESEKASHNILG